MRSVLISVLAMLAINLWAASPGPGMTADEAQAELTAGNDRFVAGTAQHPHQDIYRRQDTATNGQHPFATIIGCSDSRVPIEILFDQGIGDVFIIRVAGNVIDTDEAGSIEYGVDHLNTPLFVVLGHKGCGACTAVVTDAEVHGNIPALVDNIIPAKETVISNHPELHGQELIDAVIVENVWTAIQDLIEVSPISAKRVQNKDLKVVGAIYDLGTGKVEWLGEHPNQAQLLEDNIFQDWSSTENYSAGDIVQYHGLNYKAKWWTNNEEPGHAEVWEEK